MVIWLRPWRRCASVRQRYNTTPYASCRPCCASSQSGVRIQRRIVGKWIRTHAFSDWSPPSRRHGMGPLPRRFWRPVPWWRSTRSSTRPIRSRHFRRRSRSTHRCGCVFSLFTVMSDYRSTRSICLLPIQRCMPFIG